MKQDTFLGIFLAVLLNVAVSRPAEPQVTFSEVMFDAYGADYYDEFIEIYNLTDSVISLRGAYLLINDVVDSLDLVISGVDLAPRTYGLILDRGYLVDNLSTTYNNLISTNCIQLTTQDNSFGSNGLRNSEPNTILLLSEAGDTLSMITTTIGQEPGYSDEKIILEAPNLPENWGNSQVLFGTPGFQNSIAPRNYDLAITEFCAATDSLLPEAGSDFTFFLKVKNQGLSACSGSVVCFGEDVNCDNVLQIEEESFNQTADFEAGDSLLFYPEIGVLKAGILNLVAEVQFAADEDVSNNLAFYELMVSFPPFCLAINEFMYSPADDYGGEWVEFVNISEDTVDLRQWQISDASTISAMTLSHLRLPPKAFAVVAEDSSFLNYWQVGKYFIDCAETLPVLNNSADSILVIDPSGRVVDRLGYRSSWGAAKGVSLERKNPFLQSSNPENWGLCEAENGGTPGSPNSIRLKESDLKLWADGTYIFPPGLQAGDTAQVRVDIQNIGLNDVSDYTVEIRQHAHLDSLSVAPLLIQKAYSDTLRPLQFLTDTLDLPLHLGGVFYVECRIASLQDNDLSNNVLNMPIAVGYQDTVLVINEIMYYPESGTPEWFEIFNRSPQTVNLQSWHFKDSYSSLHALSDTAVYLNSGEYAVIAANADFRLCYPAFDGLLIIPESFPMLNNTVDSLVLKDAVGQPIDAVQYISAWGGAPGLSLERKCVDLPSQLAMNWGSCEAALGATPGVKNSIRILNYDLAMDSLYLKPVTEPPLPGDSCWIFSRIRNTGLNPLTEYELHYRLGVDQPSYSGLFFLDTSCFVIQTLESLQTRVDSMLVKDLQGGVHPLRVAVLNDFDQDPSNDRAESVLQIGYNPGSIVINEIMYTPESGESEWFELYNRGSTAVNIARWDLKDAGNSWHRLTDSTIILAPLDYAVVAANADFRQGYPGFDRSLIVPGSFPTLNNASDSLCLRDAVEHRIETVYYDRSWGGAVGISAERRNPLSAAMDSSNWGSSIALEGATPGKANSILKYNYDLALEAGSFYFVDSVTQAGHVVLFKARVRNIGRQLSDSWSAELYFDRNLSGIGEVDERVWERSQLAPLLPDSVLDLGGTVVAEVSGELCFLLRISMPSDENPMDNLASALLKVSFVPGTITLNEFLPAPTYDQTEFIEGINLALRNVDLYNWRLSSNRSQVKLNQHFSVGSGKYFILARDSSFFELFPPTTAPVLIPSSWPGLNNSADKIVLRDLAGGLMDSVRYSATWQVRSGISFEKILPVLNSADSAAWLYCLETRRATPGEINSVTPAANDLALDSLTVSTTIGDTSSTFLLEIFISNQGLNSCDFSTLKIQERFGNSSKPLKSLLMSGLQPGEADTLTTEIGPFVSGVHSLVVSLEWSKDELSSNNQKELTLRISFAEGVLKLSEFMAYPDDVAQIGQSIAEYIELFNNSGLPIEIQNWWISDENTARAAVITEARSVHPDSFLVLASDSSIFAFGGCKPANTIILTQFPTLNNTSDLIALGDPSNVLIDTLAYGPEWEVVQGTSKERVAYANPNINSNWRNCVAAAGGTPGLANSVELKLVMKKFGVKAVPNPFSPNGDGIEDEIGFHYQIPYPAAQVSIDIYDLGGRLIASPAEKIASAAEGAIYWDGESKQGGKARVGMYIARCTALDSASSKTVGYITTFVLASQ